MNGVAGAADGHPTTAYFTSKMTMVTGPERAVIGC
jgi:hypothetical protein